MFFSEKVRKNPLSYNQAGAPTGSKEPIDIEKCHGFVEFLKNKIRNGEIQEEKFDDIKKLKRLEKIVFRRNVIHKKYKELLKNLPLKLIETVSSLIRLSLYL